MLPGNPFHSSRWLTLIGVDANVCWLVLENRRSFPRLYGRPLLTLGFKSAAYVNILENLLTSVRIHPYIMTIISS